MALTLKLKCHLHPRYDPTQGGEAAIRGACVRCMGLLELTGHTSTSASRVLGRTMKTNRTTIIKDKICKKCGHAERYYKPDYDMEGGWDVYICSYECSTFVNVDGYITNESDNNSTRQSIT